ncbi:HmuY family protein [Aquimarina longa]|uniref:HmuY family protein n=1 Tax=Aquimarina longa TaxID=1080221 RepID=UPI000782ABCA|nr:HmuY family protein [Aquimarina longa]
MNTNLFFIKTLLLLFILSGCSSDDDATVQEFAVAFENPSTSFSTTDEKKDAKIVFSRNASEAGNIVVTYTAENATYGAEADFTTTPSGETGSLTIPFKQGAKEATFTINKFKNPVEGVTKGLTFSITKVSVPNSTIRGNTNMALSFTESAALGGSIAPKVGGVNYPNQVYIDLSAQKTTPVRRDTWEIAFHSGAENTVFLNSSLRITAAKLSQFTDITSVTSTTAFNPPLEINARNLFTKPISYKKVTVTTVEDYKKGVKSSYNMYESYADATDGSTTAISEISSKEEENKVYLVYMGSEIPTEPGAGSINTTGDDRGWYKIRVLMDGDAYKLQYAALDATTFTEVMINKDPNFNTVAFSLTTGKKVNVEPTKGEWDINFSGVFGSEYGTTYSDYVVHNTLGGTGLYQVTLYKTDKNGVVEKFDVPSYEDFGLANVDEKLLDFKKRNAIGSGWRNAFAKPVAKLKDDRYYIIKDKAGNYYKLRFTAVLNEKNERGNPKFEYTLLK